MPHKSKCVIKGKFTATSINLIIFYWGIDLVVILISVQSAGSVDTLQSSSVHKCQIMAILIKGRDK